MSAPVESHGPGNVYEALLAFKADVPSLEKSGVNAHFHNKFVTLEQLVAEITPVLTRYGLIWLTYPGDVLGEPSLRYELVHAASDTKIDGSMLLRSKGAGPQDQGSAITYGRRYSMMAVLDLAADPDDDGNGATRRQAPEFGAAVADGDKVTVMNALVSLIDPDGIVGDGVPDPREVAKSVAKVLATRCGYMPAIIGEALGLVLDAQRTHRAQTVDTAPKVEALPEQPPAGTVDKDHPDAAKLCTCPGGLATPMTQRKDTCPIIGHGIPF